MGYPVLVGILGFERMVVVDNNDEYVVSRQYGFDPRDYAIQKKEDEDEDDDYDDISSVDSGDFYPGDLRLPKKEIKKRKKRIRLWGAMMQGITGFVDTSDALVLRFDDGPELKETDMIHFNGLISFMWDCRHKKYLCYFTHPGQQDLGLDGAMTAYDFSELTKGMKDTYTAAARQAIDQYNNAITKKQSKLQFLFFTRCAERTGYGYLSKLFITFTAVQNGQIGTYQAAVAHDFADDVVYLILLRHVETDKILSIMTMPGVEEEWKIMYGERWDQ